MEDSFWEERLPAKDGFNYFMKILCWESPFNNITPTSLLKLRLKKIEEMRNDVFQIIPYDCKNDRMLMETALLNLEKNRSEESCKTSVISNNENAHKVSINTYSKSFPQIDKKYNKKNHLLNEEENDICNPKDNDYYDKYYTGMIKERKHRKNRKAKKHSMRVRH